MKYLKLYEEINYNKSYKDISDLLDFINNFNNNSISTLRKKLSGLVVIEKEEFICYFENAHKEVNEWVISLSYFDKSTEKISDSRFLVRSTDNDSDEFSHKLFYFISDTLSNIKKVFKKINESSILKISDPVYLEYFNYCKSTNTFNRNWFLMYLENWSERNKEIDYNNISKMSDLNIFKYFIKYDSENYRIDGEYLLKIKIINSFLDKNQNNNSKMEKILDLFKKTFHEINSTLEVNRNVYTFNLNKDKHTGWEVNMSYDLNGKTNKFSNKVNCFYKDVHFILFYDELLNKETNRIYKKINK